MAATEQLAEAEAGRRGLGGLGGLGGTDAVAAVTHDVSTHATYSNNSSSSAAVHGRSEQTLEALAVAADASDCEAGELSHRAASQASNDDDGIRDGDDIDTLSSGNGDEDDDDDDNVSTVSETFPARFSSWEELEDYIDELGASTYQVFHKRSSLSVRHRHAMVEASKRKKGRVHDRASDPDFTPVEWVYHTRVYACTCGFRNHRRGRGLRNHVVVRGTGCTAKITASVHYDAQLGTHYLKTKLKGAHNHPCDRERYYSYAENRRFEPALLREMLAMDARGCKAREILDHAAQYVSRLTGMESFYRITDVRNALRRHRGQHTAEGAWSSSTSSASTATPVIDATGVTDDVAQSGRVHDDSGSAQQQERQAADAPRSVNQVGEDAPEPAATTTGLASGTQATNNAVAPPRAMSGECSRRKRNAELMTRDAGASTSLGDRVLTMTTSPAQLRSVALSHLEALVNASYSYALAYEDIHRAVIAIPQRVPQTISGFKCDVEVLTQPHTPSDVAFVLPRFAAAGCEDAIRDMCQRTPSLPQSALGAKVVVELPSSGAKLTAVLTSRQLATMKRFHVARQHVLDVHKALQWIDAVALPSTRPAAPFDDIFDCSKTFMARSLQFMALPRTVIRGRVSDTITSVGFTDTVVGARLTKFASSTANLDVDCMKAVLLHMHSRFRGEAGIVCPNVVIESNDALAQARKASAYGAFTTPKQCVLGVLQLRSKHWSAFFYDCARHKCFLFQSLEHDVGEHRERVQELLRGFELADGVEFACSSSPTAVPVPTHDSGVLALLFLELFVRKMSWEQIPFTALAYFRLRYLLQSVQVVNCQDLHELCAS